MYLEEVTPANELKGFTKKFQKRSKEKRSEDQNVVELLGYNREGRIVCGAKVTEKAFKNNNVEKVFTSANCDEMTIRKIRYYAKMTGVSVVELELRNDELGEKLGKPFLVSMACIKRVEKNE